MYENGKQQRAESPEFKLKKAPVAFAELINVSLRNKIAVGFDVVPEV